MARLGSLISAIIQKFKFKFRKSKQETEISLPEDEKETDKEFLKEDGIQENIRSARRKGFVGAGKKSEANLEKIEKPEEIKEAANKKKIIPKSAKVKKKRIRRSFYRAAIFIFILFHLTIGALYFVLSPSFVEKQIVENFNKLSYGTITLKVKKISPLTGFLIEDLEIRNGQEFNNSVFFRLKRLKISYSLPAFLWGNFNIPEIGIYSPHVWLKQKNGIWNFAKLMKPAKDQGTKKEKKEKKEAVKKKPPSKPLAKIDLPVSFRFLFNFILDDLCLYVNAEGTKPNRKDKFNAGLEGLGFKLALEIPPIKSIQLMPPTEIVSIFNKIHIRLNKDKPLNVWYKARDIETKPALYLHFLTYLNKDSKSFRSKLKVGLVKTRIRIKRKILAPLNFIVEHDLLYEPKKDRLTLNFFRVAFKNVDWINLKGVINKVQTAPELNIRMAKSAIILSDLYPYFLTFTGKRRIKFSGRVSLKPLTIIGKQDDLKIDGALNLYNIRAKVPGLKAIHISRFHLDYHTHLKGNPPTASYFHINNLYSYINGATLRGKLKVNLRKNMPVGPMKIAFSLRNLKPERFVNAGAYGPVNLSLNINSTRGLQDIATKLRLEIKDFIYTINDSKSRPLNLAIGVDVFTSITNNMKNIDLNLQKVSVVVKNRKQQVAVRLGIDGKILVLQKKRAPIITGGINLKELYFHQKKPL